jgi:pimeloyl-ACP methyl ester carboxylesterase
VSIAGVGGFFVAGRTERCEGHPVRARVASPAAPAVSVDPNGYFRSSQMYVSEVRVACPVTPIPVGLLHGGGLSGASFEVSLDGGEPWLMSLLRAGFTTLCCDRPGLGRAGWARFPEIFAAEPRFFPAKEIWELFRIGPAGSYVSPSRRTAFPGSRFPAAHFDGLLDQFIPAFTTVPKQPMPSCSGNVVRST